MAADKFGAGAALFGAGTFSTYTRHAVVSDPSAAAPPLPVAAVAVAQGESVVTCKSPLNVLKDTYDHSFY
jgi:hypothetical protein